MIEHALLIALAASLLTPANVTAYNIYLESGSFQALCSVDIVQLGDTALVTGIYCRASPPRAASLARYVVSNIVPDIAEEMVKTPSGERTIEVGTRTGVLTIRIAWEAGEREEVFIITPLGAGLLGGVAGATIAGAVLTLKERKKYDLTAPPYEIP